MDYEFEFFLSYHGGECSSLAIAKNIRQELKEKYDIECFLYDSNRKANFDKAIDEGLKNSRNLLVIFNDKSGFESQWVESEVRNFSAMIRNGRKEGGAVFAYISGNVTVDDLCNYNSIFETSDIFDHKFDIEDLIKRAAVSKKQTNVSLKLETKINCVYSVNTKVNNIFQTEDYREVFKEDFKEFEENYYDDLAICRFARIKEMNLSQEKAFYVILSEKTDDFVSFFKREIKHDQAVLLIESESEKTVLIVKDNIYSSEKLKQIQFCGGLTISFERGEKGDIKSIKLEETHIVPQQLFAIYSDNNDYYYRYDFGKKEMKDFAFTFEPRRLQCYIADSYVKSNLFNKLSGQEKENIVTAIELAEIECDYDEKISDNSENLYRELEKALFLYYESLFAIYLKDIKVNRKINTEVLDKLRTSNYYRICNLLNDFYFGKSLTSSMESVVETLINFANSEKSISTRRYSFLLRMFIEIIINNIFIFGVDILRDKKIMESVNHEIEMATNYYVYLEMKVYKVILEKEFIFNGNYDFICENYDEAINRVLDNFTLLINEIENRNETFTNTRTIEKLAFLYRHRCVIYERMGDSEMKYDLRLKKYRLWKNDAAYVMELDEKYPNIIDQEIVGSAHINYVFASLRFLSEINSFEEKTKLLDESLIRAEKSAEILRNCASKRIIGYVYLQQAEIVDELLALYGRVLRPEFDGYFKVFQQNAKQALIIFNRTSDDFAKGWAMRFVAEEKILSGINEKNTVLVKDGLQKLSNAIQACTKGNFVREAMKCLSSFNDYLIQLHNNELLFKEVSESLKQVFILETKLLLKLIDYIKFEEENYTELQKNIINIFKGMVG